MHYVTIPSGTFLKKISEIYCFTFLSFSTFKSYKWDPQRSARWNQDAQREEGNTSENERGGVVGVLLVSELGLDDSFLSFYYKLVTLTCYIPFVQIKSARRSWYLT